jgi:hypothetical protein
MKQKLKGEWFGKISGMLLLGFAVLLRTMSVYLVSGQIVENGEEGYRKLLESFSNNKKRVLLE